MSRRKASSPVQDAAFIHSCHVTRAAQRQTQDLYLQCSCDTNGHDRHLTWGAEATIGGPSLAWPASPRAPARLFPNINSSPEPFPPSRAMSSYHTIVPSNYAPKAAHHGRRCGVGKSVSKVTRAVVSKQRAAGVHKWYNRRQEDMVYSSNVQSKDELA